MLITQKATTGQLFLAEFDENKNMISKTSIIWHTTYEITIKTDARAKYVMVFYRNDIRYQELMLNYGTNRLSYGAYKTPQTAIFPYTLNAIPVSSGGNYTDENGQQWVCDEVDFERGVYVQRIGIADQDSFKTITWSNGSICLINNTANVLSTPRKAITTLSNTYSLTWTASDHATYFMQNANQRLIIVFPKTITTGKQGEEIRQKGFKFAYVLSSPIEENLTPEEVTAFKSLATHRTTTHISNDAGAGMEVTYVADPKSYIDNKFAELSQAIVASASEAE